MMECKIYDGREGLDDEDRFLEYRERIAISDGKVRCCETRTLIPEGFPYALCQGLTSIYSEDPQWEDYPQALEFWRLLRKLQITGKTCFCFSSVMDELEYLEESDDIQAARLIKVRILATANRVKTRYAEGKQPKLHPSEQASIESGEFAEALPFEFQINNP